MNKEIALDMVNGRIAGLNAIIRIYNRDKAFHNDVMAKKKKFATIGAPKPINEVRILVEVARLEAARKDIMKRKN